MMRLRVALTPGELLQLARVVLAERTFSPTDASDTSIEVVAVDAVALAPERSGFVVTARTRVTAPQPFFRDGRATRIDLLVRLRHDGAALGFALRLLGADAAWIPDLGDALVREALAILNTRELEALPQGWSKELCVKGSEPAPPGARRRRGGPRAPAAAAVTLEFLATCTGVTVTDDALILEASVDLAMPP